MLLRIFVLCAIVASSHFCKTVPAPKVDFKTRQLTTTVERDSDWGEMRFYVDWSALTSDEKSEYEKYVDAAFTYFSNALKVHQITSNSKWDEFYNDNPYCTALYDRYNGKVIENTDMLVVITSEYNTETSYVGYSTTCGKDPVTNQPIATLIMLNKAYIDTDEKDADKVIMLMTHELSHSLGFSYSDMTDFIKSDGSKYTTDELFTVMTVRGMSDQVFLSTPKVKELARLAFGCSDLPGVQLENQGGSGSLYQHWDKRMVGTEYMNPQILINDAVYSDLSLAVFEDSGWYKPDYSYGNQINFGYDQGCDFIEKKCIIDEEPLSDEFCVNTENRICDFSHLSYGYCNLGEKTDEIPTEFQYFSDQTLGGDFFLDYCPVNYRTYDCRSQWTADSSLGEKFCLDCRCVEGTFSSGTSSYQPSCHEVTCFDSSFVVKVGDVEVTCNTDGEEISVEGYSGTLICPKFDRICADPPCRNNCYGGQCVKGKCSNGGDADGFEGEDYPDYGKSSGSSDSSGASQLIAPLAVLLSIQWLSLFW